MFKIRALKLIIIVNIIIGCTPRMMSTVGESRFKEFESWVSVARMSHEASPLAARPAKTVRIIE